MSFTETLGLLGVIIPLVIAAASGAVGLVLRVVERHTEREDKARAEKQARQDCLEKRVVSLEASDRKKTVEIYTLEGQVKDQHELLDDAVPVMTWVHDGANPPIPQVSWRWSEHLGKHRKKN